MTHIENIPHILKNGITHKDSINANPNYISIGDNSIISTRNAYPVLPKQKLGNFIPFYFGFRMPMLYVIQNGFNGVTATAPSEIVYCVSSLQQLVDHNIDFVFTNGQANAYISEVFNKSDLASINSILDFKAIEAEFWKDEKDPDLKRRKEAECLVSEDIPYSAILGFVVFNIASKEKLNTFDLKKVVKVMPKHYF